MKLTFNREGVQRLVDHTRAAPEHSATYGDAASAKPGLILVGDDGVYLMSNGMPRLPGEGDAANFVVYANECNPKTMSFDDWWAAKGASFGGDDGADWLAVENFEEALSLPGPVVTLDVTAKGIGMILPAKPKAKAKAAK